MVWNSAGCFADLLRPAIGAVHNKPARSLPCAPTAGTSGNENRSGSEGAYSKGSKIVVHSLLSKRDGNPY